MRKQLLIIPTAVLLFLAMSQAGRAQSPTTYLIQPGDTLLSIARRFQVDLLRLAQANSLANPDLILAGQTLIIPDPTLPPPTPIPEDQMRKELYITFYGLGYLPLRWHVQKLLVETELNTVVIDVKGDRGWVPYTSTVPLAQEVGAQDRTG